VRGEKETYILFIQCSARMLILSRAAANCAFQFILFAALTHIHMYACLGSHHTNRSITQPLLSLTPLAKFIVHVCCDETNNAVLQQVEPILVNLWQQHAKNTFVAFRLYWLKSFSVARLQNEVENIDFNFIFQWICLWISHWYNIINGSEKLQNNL